MAKFKIGDRVRLIDTGGDIRCSMPRGTEGTVKSIIGMNEDLILAVTDSGREIGTRFDFRFELASKFKAGDRVRCTDNSRMGDSGGGPRPKIGEVFEVQSALGNNITLKGRTGTWSVANWELAPKMKFQPGDRVRRTGFTNIQLGVNHGQEYVVEGDNGPDYIRLVGVRAPCGIQNFELVTTPEIKVGDKVTMNINSPLYDIVAHTSVMEVTSILGDYIYVRTPLRGETDGWNRKYFNLYEGPKSGDKGTIEVTYIRDNVADSTLGVFHTGQYEVYIPKDKFTVTQRGSPPKPKPKPKRERPGISSTIFHGNRAWNVDKHLNEGWFVVRELTTKQNYKLLHKNDPSWS